MVHSPVGNNRMMFGPPPTNPGTPPGMGGMGGEFSGRRTPRAPKNKSFGFDNQAPPPGVGLQPANVGNWLPPQQLPFMPPNAGLPPPPALHPNSSSMGMPSPRFFPMRSPQHPQLGGDNNMLGQLFPGGAGAAPMQPNMQPNLQAGLPPPGMNSNMNGPPPGMGGMAHPHAGGGPGAMTAPPGMGPLGPNISAMNPNSMGGNLPPGMVPMGGGGGEHDPYEKLKKRSLYA